MENKDIDKITQSIMQSDSANIDKITIINDNIYYFNETTQTICLSNLNSNDNQK